MLTRPTKTTVFSTFPIDCLVLSMLICRQLTSAML